MKKTTLELPDALMHQVKLRAADAQVLMPTLHNVADERALEAAIDLKISAYDARFIALAKQLKTKLVTEDTKLRNAVPSLTVSLADAP